MNPKVPIKNLLLYNSVVILIMMIIMMVFSDIFHLFELKTLDSRYIVRDMIGKNPKTHNSIVNVNIDDYSIKESGKISQWPKYYYSNLIDKLSESNSKVIACDIIFGDSDDTLGNSELISSIDNNGIMITPFLYSDILRDEKGQQLQADFIENSGIEFMPDFPLDVAPLEEKHLAFTSLEDIVNYSLSAGFVNITPDSDGIVRRLPVLINFGGKLSLSLFFQSLCDYLDYDISQIKIINQREIKLINFPSKDSNTFSDINIYLDKSGQFPINYVGKYNIENYPQTNSAWDIMKSKGRINFDDKLIILSDVSVVKSDYKTTPLEGVIPGSYLYTNAISSILNEDFLVEWDSISYGMYLILLIAILVLAGIYLTVNQFSAISISIIIIHIIINFAGFIYWNQIIPMTSGFIFLSSSFLFITFYRFAKSERDKGVFEGSLKSLLSPNLMSKIEKNPDILKLGGERKRITVIFADLANFTTFCDTADPAETQEVLGRYFKMAADVIFSEDGIIDKYLGDGILAFFENEGDSISSPIKATRASIELQKRALKLNELHKSQNRFPFVIRIGMTTGYAKVGNIGPPEKIDYTIIGSVVNLAARLQGVGSDNDIIIDKDTQFFIKDDYKVKSCGKKDLKGFTDQQEVYKIEYDK